MENLDALRKVWAEDKPLLDIPINGTTIKDALNLRAAELLEDKSE